MPSGTQSVSKALLHSPSQNRGSSKEQQPGRTSSRSSSYNAGPSQRSSIHPRGDDGSASGRELQKSTPASVIKQPSQGSYSAAPAHSADHRSAKDHTDRAECKRTSAGSYEQRDQRKSDPGRVAWHETAAKSALQDDDRELIQRRLREAYGFGMTSREMECISSMHSKISRGKDPRNVPKLARRVLGKDVNAVKGQIVRHVDAGRHVGAQCDGDYLSGGVDGVVLDVCGDYSQVRWDNGNVRFYYTGQTPWRKDANGKDTDNPRALRCLVLMKKK